MTRAVLNIIQVETLANELSAGLNTLEANKKQVNDFMAKGTLGRTEVEESAANKVRVHTLLTTRMQTHALYVEISKCA
jgi:hypothetical protein